jgi:hypothetical protein
VTAKEAGSRITVRFIFSDRNREIQEVRTMKAKLKFDTAVIKNFFADHWEKFVVAGSIIALLFFIVSVFKRETLPSNLQPPAIATQTVSLQEALNRSEWHDSPELKPTVVPGAIAPLPVEKLSDIPAFIRNDTRVLEDPNKRSDPTLFAVQTLQVTAGHGALATGGGGPGTGPIGAAPPAVVPSRRRDPSAPAIAAPGAAPDPAARNTRGSRRGLPPAAAPGALPGRLFNGAPPLAAEPGNAPIPAGFDLPGPPSGGSADPRVFIVVTGAVPVEQQQKEYDRRFSHARHSGGDGGSGSGGPFRGPQAGGGDVPRYVWWRLERADLTNGEEKTVIDYGDMTQIRADVQDETIGMALMRKTLKPSNAIVRLDKDLVEWLGAGPEVVPADYLGDPWLSWPLPPILLRDWGREATNPRIPLIPPQAADSPDAATPTAEPGAAKPGDDPFAKPAGDDRPTASPRSAPFQGRSRRGFDPSTPTNGPRVNSFMPRGRDPSAPRDGRGGQPVINRPADADAPQVPFKLFRFVDFEVEPGHSYQYRVQLVLKNPNFGLASELLAKPTPKPDPYRETPWSEASPATTVPLDAQLVVEAVDRAKSGEPKAKAGVLQWDKKDSLELLVKADLDLGAVANFIQKKLVAVVDPVKSVVRDVTADFVSNGALLDVHGGDDKKGAVASGGPGEMLFLVAGRDGKPDQLVVVNQAIDKPLIDGWEKTHKVPPGFESTSDTPLLPGRTGSRDTSAPVAPPSGGLIPGGPRGQTNPRDTKTPTTRPPGVGR